MRNYKFRGKPYEDVDFNEIDIHIKKEDFIYGNLIANDGYPYIVSDVVKATDEYIQLERWIPVRPETIGQFTGLLDAHGVEIYEGDLLRDEDEVWEVKWDDTDAMFVLELCNVLNLVATHFGNVSSEWYEVIGDIHENKEEKKDEHSNTKDSKN